MVAATVSKLARHPTQQYHNNYNSNCINNCYYNFNYHVSVRCGSHDMRDDDATTYTRE